MNILQNASLSPLPCVSVEFGVSEHSEVVLVGVGEG